MVVPIGVGPHEGRELELLDKGEKHIALFLECVPNGFDEFVKNSAFDVMSFPSPEKFGISVPVWILFRATHKEDAETLKELYERATVDKFNPELERKIGRLLSYSSNDIEAFIKHFYSQNSDA